MTDPIDLTTGGVLGRVTRVDTARVIVAVDDHALLTRVSVGNLVAVRGASALEFLVGIVDRITRDTQEEALVGEEHEGDEAVVSTEEVLRDAVRLVIVGTFRAAAGGARGTFKRGADSFPQIERECHLIEGGNLQALMSTFAAGMDPNERLQLGHFVADPSAVAIADGNRLFQRHAALLGSTGTGKSWAVALILERAAALGYPNLVVFDMHGEYAPLAEGERAIAARRRIAGPGDLDEPGAEALFLPYWLLNQEEMLALLLDRSDQNAPNQAARFLTHVRELKLARLNEGGHDEVAATFTVDSPVPYDIGDLIELLEADDGEMVPGANNRQVKGPFNGTLTRFIARLRTRTEDRRYGFLFRPPAASVEWDWLAAEAQQLMGSGGETPGIKIVDFSEVPSDVLPVVAGVLARTLYDVQFWMDAERRTPICFVCDEAHLYLPAGESSGAIEGRALAAFERIAKEGRKYGVSLLVVSQRPSDVNRTILSQCNNFIAMRLTNDQDQAVVRRFTSESLAGLAEVLPLLDVGEALLLGDAMLLPTRIKLDEPAIQPASATREFWSDWGSLQPDRNAIKGAVDAFRRQVRE
jgi:DNA helicase HerA-like ATPase